MFHPSGLRSDIPTLSSSERKEKLRFMIEQVINRFLLPTTSVTQRAFLREGDFSRETLGEEKRDELRRPAVRSIDRTDDFVGR